VNGLSEAGFVAGYNAGVGHIVQPPLGMVMLCVSYYASPWIGLPVHIWPAAGWTGFSILVWTFFMAGSVLTRRITASPGWAVAFQLAFMLSAIYNYFDLFGIPFYLLSLHFLAQRRWLGAYFWILVAVLIKWQFLLFVPFIALYALRDFAGERSLAWKRHAIALAPAAGLLLLIALAVGHGTFLSFVRGLSHDTLSGYALNTPWLLTWAMHSYWPESYGPLDEGMIHVLRTRDTRVLALVKLLFGSTYLYALWRQFRSPQSVDTMLCSMLAGYLAYFLFNKGVHENHLVPAVVLGGYLAFRQPQWRPAALVVAVAANLNMYFFYALDGADRGAARVVAGLDTSFLLAALYVSVLGLAYLALCGHFRRVCGDGVVAPAAGQGV